MFKRREAGQRIFPSEATAPSMAPAPAPMTTSDSILADLDYLDHVSDDEREGYVTGEQLPPIQHPGPPSFAKSGFLFRRLAFEE